MKTKNLVSNATSSVLVAGGAIAAQELGAMIPATVDPMYANIGKIVIGTLLPTFVKGKANGFAKDFSAGWVAEGALQLYAGFKTSGATVAGWDQYRPALSGWDQYSPALRGEANPLQPMMSSDLVATA